MTRKDYILLAEVFNRIGFEGDKTYYELLQRLIHELKADNPRFNADQFIRNLDK